ncbi:MAG: selenocysteine-specific translation elongation factor [Thiohalocapsa sp.]|jgi:selenocysteine-specific elongation factor|uniref:selenocysteine-specific translation elongation factor n=1 Tax=Thiohalocapsa sp. TaxID=2497641 RepID=UPI0025FE5A89|nr:selenocysteine-specific translation elongation factor [Thiohalocapsa sp.]MCG6940503.1 selenocysteine-specific translation elongation factor [Thiohalocapsa sp.]
MIIGTAGHIDHGKTALVRALTGVETDRLKEEKTRGISIELGYAYQDLPNGDVLGFIDVPGHERLIHTMLAGAGGIDFLLLVVAADDGVMPQTREHLGIVDLLGIERGALALTKIDRVDPARVDAVAADVGALLSGTALAGIPVFPLSAQTGDGVEALRAHLFDAAMTLPERDTDGDFRLAVDRSFTLQGAGTVVTGTVFSGSVEVGATLTVCPGGRRVRVRGLHAQNRPAQAGRAGQRCALNLAGTDKTAVARGDWIVAERLCVPVDRLDARVWLSAQAPQPLRQWAPVHLHLGAARGMARLVLLEGDSLAPGASALVQVVPDRPIGALYGDRFVIRDVEARYTLGGGRVLDIFAPTRKRRTPERLAMLAVLETPSVAGRLAGVIDLAAWGLDLQQLAVAWNRPRLGNELPGDCRRIQTARHDYAVAESAWQGVGRRLTEGLAVYHERAPEELGPDAARARRMWLPKSPLPLFDALVDDLIGRAAVKRTGAWLHLPGHDLSLSAAEQAVAELILPLLRASPLEPPWVRDIARELDLDETEVRALLRRMAGQGQLFQIVRDLFFVPEALARLVATVRELEAEQGGARAASFRDRTGLGRKRCIQILEYFDRVGLTRRVRDVHRLRADSPLARSAPLS